VVRQESEDTEGECGMNKFRGLLYTFAKLLGDVNAVAKGKVGRRVGRRIAGKLTGRALGRRVVCDEDLTGQRVCLCDDLFTTGITLQLCAEALRRAGAQWPPGIVTLGATERTSERPDWERERIAVRRELQRLRGARA